MLKLGKTDITEDLFMTMLQDISHKFRASNYDVFKNNCNNFTDAVASLVLGEGIPKYIF